MFPAGVLSTHYKDQKPDSAKKEQPVASPSEPSSSTKQSAEPATPTSKKGFFRSLGRKKDAKPGSATREPEPDSPEEQPQSPSGDQQLKLIEPYSSIQLPGGRSYGYVGNSSAEEPNPILRGVPQQYHPGILSGQYTYHLIPPARPEESRDPSNQRFASLPARRPVETAPFDPSSSFSGGAQQFTRPRGYSQQSAGRAPREQSPSRSSGSNASLAGRQPVEFQAQGHGGRWGHQQSGRSNPSRFPHSSGFPLPPQRGAPGQQSSGQYQSQYQSHTSPLRQQQSAYPEHRAAYPGQPYDERFQPRSSSLDQQDLYCDPEEQQEVHHDLEHREQASEYQDPEQDANQYSVDLWDAPSYLGQRSRPFEGSTTGSIRSHQRGTLSRNTSVSQGPRPRTARGQYETLSLAQQEASRYTPSIYSSNYSVEEPVPLFSPGSSPSVQRSTQSSSNVAMTSTATPRDTRPSTATGDYKSQAGGSSITGASSVSGHGRITDTVDRRVATLDYLKKTHDENRVYWLNTLLIRQEDVQKLPYCEGTKMTRRATSLFHLGNSLLEFLQPHRDNFIEYVRVFNGVLENFESYLALHPLDGNPPSTMSRVRMPHMFKRVASGSAAQGKGRRGGDFGSSPGAGDSSDNVAQAGLGAGTTSNLGHNADFPFLLLPHMPYDVDYFQVFQTLCDALIEAYSNLLVIMTNVDAATAFEHFTRLDMKVKKIVITGLMRDFDTSVRTGIHSEFAGLAKITLGPLTK